MKVRDHMTSKVVTVARTANVAEIAALLAEHRITGVPVIDSDGSLAGVVTHEEIMNIFVPHYLSMFDDLAFLDDLGAIETQTMAEIEPSLFLAEDIMVADPATVRPETSVMKVAALMVNKKLVFVPVVDEARRVVGVMTRNDVSAAFTGVVR
jgi:CBS domain-containing protein